MRFSLPSIKCSPAPVLPAFDCCRARGDQIVVQSSDNEQSSAVVISWEESANIWLTVAKNAFVGWAFNFRVRVLLKSAVKENGAKNGSACARSHLVLPYSANWQIRVVELAEWHRHQNYVPVNSKLQHPPPSPGIPWAFDVFSCLGGREFDHHS